MAEPIENAQLKIRQLKSQLLDNEVDEILLKLALAAAMAAFKGEAVDTMPYARKIVAHCREHL